MSTTISYTLCMNDIQEAICDVITAMVNIDDVIDMDRYRFNNQDGDQVIMRDLAERINYYANFTDTDFAKEEESIWDDVDDFIIQYTQKNGYFVKETNAHKQVTFSHNWNSMYEAILRIMEDYRYIHCSTVDSDDPYEYKYHYRGCSGPVNKNEPTHYPYC